jgi:flagellar biosynthesis chaperone FliJ
MDKIKLAIFTLLALPMSVSAQSTYEHISALPQDTIISSPNTVSASELESAAGLTSEEKAYRDRFISDLQTTGQKINENAEVWQQETAKRGYPKKKTVQEKARLVDHYIFLLSTQLSDSRLNRFIDKQKVQNKITYWQNYRQALNKLM